MIHSLEKGKLTENILVEVQISNEFEDSAMEIQ